MARLPFGYSVWRRLGVFQHGTMERPAYALSVFTRHYDRAFFGRKGGGFVALELGPGDSVVSALIAYSYGAQSSYLTDVGDFATRDMKVYREMAAHLACNNRTVPTTDAIDFDEMLSKCGSTYSTDGLAALERIPAESVDFIWSHAVLEHIRLADFGNVMRQLRRILRADGVCSHRIDLSDHLGGALNNLRFPSVIWESGFFARSGFYTNRLSYAKILRLFEDAGFDVKVVTVDRWDTLPTPRSALAHQFREIPDEQLRIFGFDVILRPRH